MVSGSGTTVTGNTNARNRMSAACADSALAAETELTVLARCRTLHHDKLTLTLASRK